MIALSEKLTIAIAALPPRRDTARQLAPSLAYGRHRGPAPKTARRAAVLLALLKREDGSIFLPLTMRPKSLKHHGGQISLPGGKVELGESDLQAALREFHEELGLPLVHPLCCGSLSPLYVYGSDNLVSPLVMVAEAPKTPWQPDLLEVDRVIELPVEVLHSNHTRVRVKRTRAILRDNQSIGELKFTAPAYRYKNFRIWGATAMLLAELGSLLKAF